MTNETSDPATASSTNGANQQRSTSAGWLATLRARLGLGEQRTLRETFEEALRTPDRTEAAFSATERNMLLRLLRFGSLRLDDVMVPRADIIAIDITASIAELLALFRSAGVSRIPVYQDTLDDPRGMIHIKDLVRYLLGDDATQKSDEAVGGPPLTPDEVERMFRNAKLTNSIAGAKLHRRLLNVPPSMSALNLLIQMQATRAHMALVVDEYGGTDGLVTIEDLIEQVVGDIEDEHDVAEAANIVQQSDQVLVAQARTPVAELEAHLGMKLLLPEEQAEIDTIGGLVFSIVGRVPARGEIVRHASGIEFEVLEADPRRITSLKVHRPGPVSPPLAELGVQSDKGTDGSQGRTGSGS